MGNDAQRDEMAQKSGRKLTGSERQLLVLLTRGLTDVAVAQELDVSVRTERRMVADLLRRLGATSRFEAGVKAAQRGWC